MMTEEQRLAYQRDWTARLAEQPPHPVYLPVRVRWDLPWDARGAVVEIGSRVAVDEGRLDRGMGDKAEQAYRAALQAGRSELEALAAQRAVRADAWQDESFVVAAQFVQWPGVELRTPAGVPMVPWGTPGPEGKEIKPLTLLMQARRTMCEGTDADPYQSGWISEGHRAIFIEMCKLRLARPGEVLELLLLGGNRAGKTFVMIGAAVWNWLASPRPAGAEYGPQWKGQSLIMHSGETISGSEHQVPFYFQMPKSVRTQARGKAGGARMTKTEDTVFNFTGSGFTNGSFNLPVEIPAPDGVGSVISGGEVRFRSYNGSPNTYEGPEYNLILTDEEVQAQVYENQKRGMTSRAMVTQEQWFLDEIRRLLALLEGGVPMARIPRHLLGLMMQSWLGAMFTPVSGFTQLVRKKLQGITHRHMWGWYPSPVLAGMEGVPVDARKPGGDKRLVPQFARDPENPNQLIAWFHTRWNCVKPAVRTMLGAYKAAGWKEVRKRLYGYVESDTSSSFGEVFDEDVHLCDWKDIPREGTIYEVLDPGGAKPWAMGWYLVDVADRIWMLQEWPCESIEVNGAKPGPWAVPSAKERLNGDEGPAYHLPKRSLSQWCRQIWDGRARLIDLFKATGEPFQGSVETVGLATKWHYDERLLKVVERDPEREFVKPRLTVIDSRAAAAGVDSVKGNERVTVLERLREDANSLKCHPASGVNTDEGDILIVSRLADRLLDGGAILINRECTNTQFMLRHRTLPPHRESTATKDEVCEEWRDLLAYLLLEEPRHYKPRKSAHDGEWGY